MADSNTRSQVYKGLSSQTFIVAIMGVLEIGVFALMSRLLTPEDFGYYAIILAIVSVFQCLTEAGLGSAVIQRSNASEEFISTALGWSTILGLGFSLILIALAHPLSMLMGYGTELTNSLRWMSVTVLLCSVNSVARALFMKTLDFMKFGWCQVAAYIISSGVGILLAVKGYGANAVVGSAITNAVLMTLILFGVRGTVPNLRIYACHTKDILSYGGWLTGSVIVRRITTELDKFILTRWIPVEQIGAYNRPAGFISSITDRFTGIYDIVLFPILSSFNEDAKRVQNSFLTATSLVSWFSVIIAFAFVLGAPLIIGIFFGEDWKWMVDIFMILSLSVVATAYNRMGDCYFRSLGLVKSYFYLRVVMCLLTLVCVYVGCQYGILGVAIGLLVSRTLESIYKLTYFAVKLGINFVQLVKAIVIPIWTTMLVAMVCFVFMKYVAVGEYTAVFIFGAVILLMSIFAPTIFGKGYYENVYLVARKKISGK